MKPPEQTISAVRVIDASADELYAAWTDPAVMRRWMARSVDADVRVGGRYRNELDAGEAGTFVHAGEYLVLEPARRIVQTFRVDGAEPGPDRDERLEVTLRPLGPAQTELTFTDGWDGPALDKAGADAAEAAWSGWLNQLQELYAS